ncbi:MAG: HAD hydrolase-like protein [Kiritimatiellae bacterium]|nr:HAD hydrolase-like protein [Kiritimatiellia bacterium]
MSVGAAVFDFGGVMTTSTMPQRVVELARERGVDWDVFARGFEAHRLDFDAGFITIDEMYDLIWRDAGLSVPAETTAAFIDADTRSWCCRNERTLAWMRALKARGFGIGILTNMAPAFAREHFETKFADFIALADAMVVSGYEGIVKPQRAIYDLLRARIARPAAELCFVDDLERNVAAARAAGWQAIRFQSNEQVEADFERLVR